MRQDEDSRAKLACARESLQDARLRLVNFRAPVSPVKELGQVVIIVAQLKYFLIYSYKPHAKAKHF